MDTLQLTLILFIHLLVLNLLNRRVAVLYLSRALPKTNHRLSDELPFGQGKDRSSICFIICVHCDLSLSLYKYLTSKASYFCMHRLLKYNK